jgi:hypothetical protein
MKIPVSNDLPLGPTKIVKSLCTLMIKIILENFKNVTNVLKDTQPIPVIVILLLVVIKVPFIPYKLILKLLIY